MTASSLSEDLPFLVQGSGMWTWRGKSEYVVENQITIRYVDVYSHPSAQLARQAQSPLYLGRSVKL